MRRDAIVALAWAVLCAAHVPAGAGPAPIESAWDTRQPRGEPRRIDFETEEGSWMSLDVSPDGRWIAFDLLGHIYRLPIEGGRAQCLTQDSGIAVNFHPRISPDGTQVAFVSERRGYHNLWIMGTDGSGARLLVEEKDVVVSAPAWSPDGRSLIAQRVSTKISGSYPKTAQSLWRYPADGGAPTEIIVPQRQGVSAPAVSTDGRHVYYQYFAGSDPRNVDVTAGDYRLARHLLRSGETEVVSLNGGLLPRPSPDGRRLAFARRLPKATMEHAGQVHGPRNALWLLDLDTRAERVVMDPLDPDIADGGNINTVIPALFPAYAWMPDGRSIVIAQGGKIRRLMLDSGEIRTIPFVARVQRAISQKAGRPQRIRSEDLRPRYLSAMRASRDGRRLAFEAAGRLWMADLPGAEARRLTPEGFPPGEFMPAWSPDGGSLAFVSWDAKRRGAVWLMPATGGPPRKITKEPGEFANPVWSADGRSIVVVRGWGATAQGRTWGDNPTYVLARIPVEGGEPVDIAEVAPRAEGLIAPVLGPEGRIFYVEDEPHEFEPVSRLVSIDPAGRDRRVHLKLPYAAAVAPSPDGRWVAFEKRSDVFLAPFDWRAAVTSLTRDQVYGASRGEVRRLSREGGLDPHWRGNDELEFAGTGYSVHRPSSGATNRVRIGLSIPMHASRQRVALVGARLVTLRAGEIFENGSVVLRGDRIECVGRCRLDGSERVVDVTGATIVPGFVDGHAAFVEQGEKLSALGNADAAAYLAYGITTSFAPSNASHFIYPLAEMIEAGATPGPRIFSAADYYRRDDNARSQFVELPDVASARDDARRNARFGAVSLKNLTLSTAVARQQLAEAARLEGLRITGHLETGFLEHGLSLAMEGYTGAQHFPAAVPLYADVAKFFGQAEFAFNLTLGRMGTIRNDAYFMARGEFAGEGKRERLFSAHSPILNGQRRRELRDATDYSFGLQADAVAAIVREGGHAGIGTHGPGYAAHWEIWMLAAAMGPRAALEAASLGGARFLGIDADIGSLEVGKLADLLVLDANPLDDIRNTAAIRYVMKAGVLYEGDTLEEVRLGSSAASKEKPAR